MKKRKAYLEFIELATAFLAMSQQWSPKNVTRLTDTIVKDEETIRTWLAVPLEWEPKLERLVISAKITLLTKGALTNNSYAIVKKNLTRATVFIDPTDQCPYVRLNNFVIKLV